MSGIDCVNCAHVGNTEACRKRIKDVREGDIVDCYEKKTKGDVEKWSRKKRG